MPSSTGSKEIWSNMIGSCPARKGPKALVQGYLVYLQAMIHLYSDIYPVCSFAGLGDRDRRGVDLDGGYPDAQALEHLGLRSVGGVLSVLGLNCRVGGEGGYASRASGWELRLVAVLKEPLQKGHLTPKLTLARAFLCCIFSGVGEGKAGPDSPIGRG